MNVSDLKEHLDRRLDGLSSELKDEIKGLSEKVDNHLERISKAETSIEWIRGHLRISVTLLISALTGVTAALYHFLSSGKGPM